MPREIGRIVMENSLQATNHSGKFDRDFNGMLKFLIPLKKWTGRIQPVASAGS
jgi:hypothetical protein